MDSFNIALGIISGILIGKVSQMTYKFYNNYLDMENNRDTYFHKRLYEIQDEIEVLKERVRRMSDNNQ